MPDPTPGERTRVMLRQTLENHAHSWDEAHQTACYLLWGVKRSLASIGMDTTGFPAHWVGFLRRGVPWPSSPSVMQP
jgi:hypothetical protein